ncbi:hypothetical protein SAMN05518849_11843 [Sphingobium sp. AP50]|nr:hypothetical protein SAMN05518849_11843 [Sphingobium sp. AP50]
MNPPWLPRTLIEQIEVLAKLALMIGAVIAAREYFDQRNDMRVTRTLEFASRFDGSEYLGVRQAVGKALAEKARALRTEAEAGTDRPKDPELIAARADKAALALVFGSEGNKGLENEIGQIAGFFSSLQVCVDRNICDAETAHAVFDAYAKSFWSNFEPYFRDLQRITPEAGAGLEKFAGTNA